MIPFNLKVPAKFGLCSNCSQKLEMCSLASAHKKGVLCRLIFIEFEITKFRPHCCINGSPVFCTQTDPVFSTETPCFPHPGTPYPGLRPRVFYLANQAQCEGRRSLNSHLLINCTCRCWQLFDWLRVWITKRKIWLRRRHCCVMCRRQDTQLASFL